MGEGMNMTAAEWIVAIVMFGIAGILILLGVRSFLCRGFLLNNAYIYASKEERETMNKRPYYRQTAIIFCLLSMVFLINGVSVILQNYRLELWLIPVIAGAVVYAIVSTKRIQRQNKNTITEENDD